jgi:acyl carrier protein
MVEDARTTPAFVLREVAAHFGVPTVSPADTLVGLRAGSVSILRLMAALRDRFDISIDVVDMFQAVAVSDLVVLVADSMSRRPAEPHHHQAR